MLDLFAFKLLAAFTLIAVGVGCGLLPYRISISSNGQKWLIYGNALAGGIFLGAGLLHLLPDGDELLTSLGGLPAYPLVFLLAGIGFLLVLLLEQVMAQGQEEEDLISSQESSPIILFVILSVHSFIAGAAFGLETSVSGVVAIFIAIVAHKGFAALALGIALVDARMPLWRIVEIIVAFSLMTPIGVLVGTGFSEVLESEVAIGTESVFDGLAAGTFIYIATLEMIGQVFHIEVDRVQKFLFVASGFSFMALLAIWS